MNVRMNLGTRPVCGSAVAARLRAHQPRVPLSGGGTRHAPAYARARASDSARCSCSTKSPEDVGAPVEGIVPSPPASPPPPSSAQVEKTLNDLNAILGIDEEEEQAEQATPAVDATPVPAATLAPDLLSKIPQADLDQMSPEEAAKLKDAAEQVAKIVSEVKTGKSSSDESMRKEFERLVEMLKPEDLEKRVSRDDCKAIKEKVFGADTFWVTDMVPNDDLIGGMLFKGNLRGDLAEIFPKVDEQVRELFDAKYEILVIEDDDAMDGDFDVASAAAGGRPRVSFLLLPKAIATPPTTTRLQWFFAVLLGLLGFLSCMQVRSHQQPTVPFRKTQAFTLPVPILFRMC